MNGDDFVGTHCSPMAELRRADARRAQYEYDTAVATYARAKQHKDIMEKECNAAKNQSARAWQELSVAERNLRTAKMAEALG